MVPLAIWQEYANDRRGRDVPYIGVTIAQSVDSLPDPVCREVIVIKTDMPMQSWCFRARACRLERAVNLPRRSMVDQPDQMRAGRLLGERADLDARVASWVALLARLVCLPLDFALKSSIEGHLCSYRYVNREIMLMSTA